MEKDQAEEKKKRKVETMETFWNALRNKTDEEQALSEIEDIEEVFDDPDLIAGPSTSG